MSKYPMGRVLSPMKVLTKLIELLPVRYCGEARSKKTDK